MKNKISEEQVFEAYKDGLPQNFEFTKKNIRRKAVNLKGATVQISMKIDYDLLQEIKETAGEEGLPYQTLIKQILKDYLKRPGLEQRFQKIENRLLQLESQI